MRGLAVAAVAGILFLFEASQVGARDEIGRRAAGPLPAYQGVIAQIIAQRMQDRGYRTLSGGVASVTFVLQRSGVVTAAVVTKPSGSPYIDGLALASVREGSVFPPFPRDLGFDTLRISVPLRFEARP